MARQPTVTLTQREGWRVPGLILDGRLPVRVLRGLASGYFEYERCWMEHGKTEPDEWIEYDKLHWHAWVSRRAGHISNIVPISEN